MYSNGGYFVLNFNGSAITSTPIKNTKLYETLQRVKGKNIKIYNISSNDNYNIDSKWIENVSIQIKDNVIYLIFDVPDYSRFVRNQIVVSPEEYYGVSYSISYTPTNSINSLATEER